MRGNVAHHHLVALHHHDAVYGAGVLRCPAAAPAQGFDLQDLHFVGEFDEPLRAREQSGAEVGSDAERKDVHLHLIHNPRQLLHLGGRVELGLITNEVVHPQSVGSPGHHFVPEIGVAHNLHGVGLQAQPAGDP